MNWFDNDEFCLEAVIENGYALEYMKNPNEQIQLEAVKQNKNCIILIDNPSEQVIVAALQNGLDEFDCIKISEEDKIKIKEKYPEYFI